MLKDAKFAENQVHKLPMAEAKLTFVARKDPITGEEFPDQPVPKLECKNPPIFPVNGPSGITYGMYIPGRMPTTRFEVEQLQKEWAVIKCSDEANRKEIIIDEWPPIERPILAMINGRTNYTEGMLAVAEHTHLTGDGEKKTERTIVFMELLREGSFEYAASTVVKYGEHGVFVPAQFIPVDMNNVYAWAYLSVDGQVFRRPGWWNEPMDLFADCEFDDNSKALLSIGITNKLGKTYYAFDSVAASRIDNKWVEENVVPIMLDVPPNTVVTDLAATGSTFSNWLAEVLKANQNPHWSDLCQDFVIHVDFPTDVAYIADLLHLGEGKRIGQMRNFTFKIDYVDSYPTQLKDAVQHNAAWDSLALWLHLGYLSYRIIDDLMKRTTDEHGHVDAKKLPPMIESMIQGVLKVSPEAMEKLQQGLENPVPPGAELQAAMKKFRDQK